MEKYIIKKPALKTYVCIELNRAELQDIYNIINNEYLTQDCKRILASLIYDDDSGYLPEQPCKKMLDSAEYYKRIRLLNKPVHLYCKNLGIQNYTDVTLYDVKNLIPDMVTEFKNIHDMNIADNYTWKNAIDNVLRLVYTGSKW